MKYLRFLPHAVFCFFAVSISAQTQPHISIMTFNIENGGTQVSFDKVVEAVKTAKADVVGIQEAWGNTCRLATAVGWKYCAPHQNIASKFPLFEKPETNYVFVEIQPEKFVAMANMHLPDEPYGPDLVKKGYAVTEVIANERKVRLPTAIDFIQSLKSLSQKEFPVFLTGDFNSPSQLDWSAETIHRLPNRPYAVAWPVTSLLQSEGFVDSFRKVQPNPVKIPGYTWPADRPILKNAIDGFNPTINTLSDRLDFIFSAGPATVLTSRISGESDVTPWPSDHRAVVSVFKVVPVAISKNNLQAIVVENEKHPSPQISTDKLVYHSGEAIKISWKNAPRNRYDYINIVPVGTSVSAPNTLRLYLEHRSEGSLTYSSKNSQGNWTQWFHSDLPKWPLKPGKYLIQLMLDDSFQPLAATTITVK